MSIFGTLKSQATLTGLGLKKTRTLSLITELEGQGNMHLTADEGAARVGAHVGWIHKNLETQRYEPVMLGEGCADGTSFLSLAAAELMALTHYAERLALQDD